MKPTEFSGRIVEWNSYRLLSPAGVWQGSNSYANAAGRRAVPQDGCGQELPSLQAATVRAAQRAGSHGGRGCGQFQTGRLMSCRDCRARHDELRWDGIFFASGACRTWAAAGWMEWRGRHQNSTGRKSGEKHTQAAVICLRLGYPREPQEVDMPLVDKQRQWHRRVLWMELAPGEGGLCCPCCVYCTVRLSYNIIPGTVTRYSLLVATLSACLSRCMSTARHCSYTQSPSRLTALYTSQHSHPRRKARITLTYSLFLSRCSQVGTPNFLQRSHRLTSAFRLHRV